MSATLSQLPARLRLDFVEGMRAVAALAVVFNHAYGQTWNSSAQQFPPPALDLLTYSLVTGHLAVSVFITVSGFCLMLPVVRNDGALAGGVAQFFRKRARRILPPYYAAVAFSLVLIATVIGEPTGSLWDVSIAIRKSDLAAHLLLLQDFFGTGRINYAFWSIALEWQLYFTFPLLVLLFKKRGPLFTVLAALAVGYAISLGLRGGRVERANLHYLGLFALGMAAAWAATSTEGPAARLRASLPWLPLGLALVLPMPFLMKHWGWLESMRWWPLFDLLSGAATACVLVAGAIREGGPVRSLFELRPLVVVGRFSYSLYLIHAPLLQILWQYVTVPAGLGSAATFAFLMTAGTLLITLISWLFHLAFEAPFMKASRVTPAGAPAIAR